MVRLVAESGCTATWTRPAAEPITLLVESRLPPARMLVFGANDFGAALVPAAQLLGYHVTLCDARPAFAGQARFAAPTRWSRTGRTATSQPKPPQAGSTPAPSSAS